MNKYWNRREVLAASTLLGTLPGLALAEDKTPMRTAAIPSSGEQLPIIGLGTYRVFDVESTAENIARRKEIVELLLGEGGSVIDTSPMYNRSEKMIGDVILTGTDRDALFIATKVWTDGQDAGIAQMNRSEELMKTDVIDLMQVHNLRGTDIHMKTIREWQEDSRIRYSGITHYADSALDELQAAMRKHKPQFIQINYSLGEREADLRVLPLARELGIAVLINRPYQGGRLFRAVAGQVLPEWAKPFAASWGQFFLKFIVSHPAVTCVIPATSKAHHMADNLEAGFGPLPDAATRRRMIEFIRAT